MAVPPLPCLVLDYGVKRPMKLYAAADGAYRPCKTGPLLTKQNWVTAQGWVLARDPDTSATFLWDPRDPEHGRVSLPSMAQAPPLGSHCAVSGDPTTAFGGCTVVLAEPYDSTVLWYCHIGSATPEWVRHEYDLGGNLAVSHEHREWSKNHVSKLTPYGGKFYDAMFKECRVLQFSPEPAWSTVKTKGLDFSCHPDVGVYNCFVLDMDGKLYTVWISFADLDLRTVHDVVVYKMGFGRSRCVRVNNIGGRAILASSGRASWCPANTFRLRPNTLYWMNPYNYRKCLHMYDIRSKKEVVKECEGSMELSRMPFWLVPVHRP